ncbi:MAG: hypothetical protein KDA91_11380 [Planctomycetaceae bacterium]|nr:hypothetical protein [Planctomycetaceae bacterium]
MIVSNAQHELQDVPVCGGVCFPRNTLRDVTRARFRVPSDPNDGREGGTAQTEVLDRWSDGSIRWLLASLVVPRVAGSPPTSKTGQRIPVILDLSCDEDHQKESDQRQLTSVAAAAEITTTVKYSGGQIIVVIRNDCDRHLQERTLRLTSRLSDTSNQPMHVEWKSVRQETQGEVRRVFVVNGCVRECPDVMLQVRLTHWVQIGQLQVETRLRNSRRARHKGGLWDLGDSGSFCFRSLDFELQLDELGVSNDVYWQAEPNQNFRRHTAKETLRVQQNGSGFRNWSSTNHRTDQATTSVADRGYQVQSSNGTFRGYHAQPTVVLVSETGSFSVSQPEFWQQFPSSIEVNKGQLIWGVMPEHAGDANYELQGGEQKTKTTWIALHNDHSSERDILPAGALAHVCSVTRIIQSGASFAEANVLPWFPGDYPARDADTGTGFPTSGSERPVDDDLRRLSSYLADATSGDFSLEARRRKIDEFGWRNFGDIPADHEQTHYEGSNTIVSHYNNQFDLIFGAILQFAASADLRWIDLFDPLARHVMDIDIYHTTQDREVFNGGLFWHTDHYVDARTATHRTYSRENQKPGRPYGGGPGNEHNYTTGLLYYFYLTGNPEARESVLLLADWVLRMDDGRNTIFGILDDGPTGHASATVFEDFHGPGRGAGNSINALLDAWLLTRDDRYLLKSEELIRRCVHPEQDLHSLHLTDAEGHWSYSVFLTSLGRYLLIKQEADQLDEMYSYARETMRHYGRWMVVHEKRTLSEPDKLEYPTEAWAAQDFRKANTLRLAANCEDEPRLAAAMRSKARELNNFAWSDLYDFGDAHLTARCLSILMTEGQRDLFHRTCAPQPIPSGELQWRQSPECAAQWSMFIPQKERVRRILKSPVHLAGAVVRALNPNRCRRAIQAFRRQI